MSDKLGSISLIYKNVHREFTIPYSKSEAVIKESIDSLFSDKQSNVMGLRVSSGKTIIPLFFFEVSKEPLSVMWNKLGKSAIVIDYNAFSKRQLQKIVLEFASLESFIDSMGIGESIHPLELAFMLSAVAEGVCIGQVQQLMNWVFLSTETITRMDLWQLLITFISYNRYTQLSLLFSLFDCDGKQYLTFNEAVCMLSTYFWLDYTSYCVGRIDLHHLRSLKEVGKQCASSMYNDLLLISTEGISFSDLFHWIYYHGMDYIHSEVFPCDEDAPMTLRFHSCYVSSIWFMYIGKKCNYDETLQCLQDMRKGKEFLTEKEVYCYLACLLQPNLRDSYGDYEELCELIIQSTRNDVGSIPIQSFILYLCYMCLLYFSRKARETVGLTSIMFNLFKVMDNDTCITLSAVSDLVMSSLLYCQSVEVSPTRHLSVLSEGVDDNEAMASCIMKQFCEYWGIQEADNKKPIVTMSQFSDLVRRIGCCYEHKASRARLTMALLSTLKTKANTRNSYVIIDKTKRCADDKMVLEQRDRCSVLVNLFGPDDPNSSILYELDKEHGFICKEVEIKDSYCLRRIRNVLSSEVVNPPALTSISLHIQSIYSKLAECLHIQDCSFSVIKSFFETRQHEECLYYSDFVSIITEFYTFADITPIPPNQIASLFSFLDVSSSAVIPYELVYFLLALLCIKDGEEFWGMLSFVCKTKEEMHAIKGLIIVVLAIYYWGCPHLLDMYGKSMSDVVYMMFNELIKTDYDQKSILAWYDAGGLLAERFIMHNDSIASRRDDICQCLGIEYIETEDIMENIENCFDEKSLENYVSLSEFIQFWNRHYPVSPVSKREQRRMEILTDIFMALSKPVSLDSVKEFITVGTDESSVSLMNMKDLYLFICCMRQTSIETIMNCVTRVDSTSLRSASCRNVLDVLLASTFYLETGIDCGYECERQLLLQLLVKHLQTLSNSQDIHMDDAINLVLYFSSIFLPIPDSVNRAKPKLDVRESKEIERIVVILKKYICSIVEDLKTICDRDGICYEGDYVNVVRNYVWKEESSNQLQLWNILNGVWLCCSKGSHECDYYEIGLCFIGVVSFDEECCSELYRILHGSDRIDDVFYSYHEVYRFFEFFISVFDCLTGCCDNHALLADDYAARCASMCYVYNEAEKTSSLQLLELSDFVSSEPLFELVSVPIENVCLPCSPPPIRLSTSSIMRSSGVAKPESNHLNVPIVQSMGVSSVPPVNSSGNHLSSDEESEILRDSAFGPPKYRKVLSSVPSDPVKEQEKDLNPDTIPLAIPVAVSKCPSAVSDPPAYAIPMAPPELVHHHSYVPAIPSIPYLPPALHATDSYPPPLAASASYVSPPSIPHNGEVTVLGSQSSLPPSTEIVIPSADALNPLMTTAVFSSIHEKASLMKNRSDIGGSAMSSLPTYSRGPSVSDPGTIGGSAISQPIPSQEGVNMVNVRSEGMQESTSHTATPIVPGLKLMISGITRERREEKMKEEILKEYSDEELNRMCDSVIYSCISMFLSQCPVNYSVNTIEGAFEKYSKGKREISRNEFVNTVVDAVMSTATEQERDEKLQPFVKWLRRVYDGYNIWRDDKTPIICPLSALFFIKLEKGEEKLSDSIRKTCVHLYNSTSMSKAQLHESASLMDCFLATAINIVYSPFQSEGIDFVKTVTTVYDEEKSIFTIDEAVTAMMKGITAVERTFLTIPHPPTSSNASEWRWNLELDQVTCSSVMNGLKNTELLLCMRAIDEKIRKEKAGTCIEEDERITKDAFRIIVVSFFDKMGIKPNRQTCKAFVAKLYKCLYDTEGFVSYISALLSLSFIIPRPSSLDCSQVYNYVATLYAFIETLLYDTPNAVMASHITSYLRLLVPMYTALGEHLEIPLKTFIDIVNHLMSIDGQSTSTATITRSAFIGKMMLLIKEPDQNKQTFCKYVLL